MEQWSNEQMENAMRAVEEGSLGINQAAREYGVPKTTLKDRISGRIHPELLLSDQCSLVSADNLEIKK